jgi:lipopolysaccharide biosynthesis protein
VNTPAVDARRDAAATAIAMYLPQYHPVKENDEWWGRGFTEWTNTASARRLFPGHRQPRVPGELGFYDLRLAETRVAQAELAQEHGIAAFCYWHYWFAGRRILERPFTEVLASGEPQFRFCLAWANQSWSGIAHGAPRRTLITQTYPGREDEKAHFASVLPAFLDRRYLRIEDRPLFLVYRPELLPNAREFTDHWRDLAADAGLPGLFLVADIRNDFADRPPDALEFMGLDGAVFVDLPVDRARRPPLIASAVTRLRGGPEVLCHSESYVGAPFTQTRPIFPCVFPNWDNSPRTGRQGIAVVGSSPRILKSHMEGAVASVSRLPVEQRLVFLKSWNEWAEGNYLEPDLEHGRDFLRAVAAGLNVSNE